VTGLSEDYMMRTRDKSKSQRVKSLRIFLFLLMEMLGLDGGLTGKDQVNMKKIQSSLILKESIQTKFNKMDWQAVGSRLLFRA
jgi:hypothetical protein